MAEIFTEAMQEVMDVLFDHRHGVSDASFLDISNALQLAYDRTAPVAPVPPPEAGRMHVRLHVPGVGKLDLGAFPNYEDSSRFSTTRPPRGFRRLPATKYGVHETWAVLEPANDGFMLETMAYGLLEDKMLVRKKPSGFDDDAKRFNVHCHRSLACDYFEDGSVYLQLTGPGLSEGNHNLPLQVLDAEKMMFYVRGFGSYCMVLALLPSPALVLLHTREDEMMVDDPSVMHFKMAMVAWRGNYWSGAVNGC